MVINEAIWPNDQGDETSPRTNVLSHALVYYSISGKHVRFYYSHVLATNSDHSLVVQWKRANNIYRVSQQTFLQLPSTEGYCNVHAIEPTCVSQ